MSLVLQANNISKTFFDGKSRIKALDNVSLTLDEGQLLGIVGESGSGKSTLLKALAGLIPIDAGEICIDGKSVANSSPAVMGKYLQMIFQDAITSFDPRMQLEKSVMEAAADGITMEAVISLTERLGLDKELLKKRPGQLSGGQCQRMSISRALLSGARIILCDEITSALDVVTQAQIVDIIKDMKVHSKVSIIFVSHDIALASSICDRLMVMHAGRVVEEGKAEIILNNPRAEYTKSLIASARVQSL